MTTWRVLINDRLWDQEAYAHGRIAQSKGRCTMRVLPMKDDVVLFVIKGFVVMKGIAECDGFEHGSAHREDPANRGILRAHADPDEFAWIHSIVLCKEPEPIDWKGQRTWVKL